ncbi:MAG: hypothetical protein AAF226_00510, partial [Verrucomicrobiota bacterium]
MQLTARLFLVLGIASLTFVGCERHDFSETKVLHQGHGGGHGDHGDGHGGHDDHAKDGYHAKDDHHAKGDDHGKESHAKPEKTKAKPE